MSGTVSNDRISELRIRQQKMRKCTLKIRNRVEFSPLVCYNIQGVFCQ
nr:MAG TPA: hypothetical protein [Caudoviricetes sp.]